MYGQHSQLAAGALLRHGAARHGLQPKTDPEVGHDDEQ